MSKIRKFSLKPFQIIYVCLAVLCLQMAAVLLLPGAARGGIWLGAQAGLHYIPDTNIVQKESPGFQRTYENVTFDTNFSGGLTLGYDFVNKGFGGNVWPDWMKHVSLVLDLTYEDIGFKHQWVNTGSGVELTPCGNVRMFTITPMIIGKYGFIPDAEMPFGRLQPYVGFGPGVIISNSDVSGLTVRGSNKVDMALVVESGLRYMLSRNVSLDAAFRYRTITTEFGHSYDAPGADEKIDLDFDPKLYSVIFRVAYHFSGNQPPAAVNEPAKKNVYGIISVGGGGFLPVGDLDDFDKSYNGTFSAGVTLGRLTGLGIDISYRESDEKTQYDDETTTLSTIGLDYLFYLQPNDWRVQPYLAAGLGLYFNHLDRWKGQELYVGTGIGYGVVGKAGIRFFITDNLFIGASAKYFTNWQEIKIRHTSPSTYYEDKTVDLGGLVGHIELGLKF